MTNNVAQTLRQQRIDLAAAFRWTARLGMHEGIGNHFTLAVNDDGSEFLVNPWGKHFSKIKASDLLRVDRKGNVLEGDASSSAPPFAFMRRCTTDSHTPAASCIVTRRM